MSTWPGRPFKTAKRRRPSSWAPGRGARRRRAASAAANTSGRFLLARRLRKCLIYSAQAGEIEREELGQAEIGLAGARLGETWKRARQSPASFENQLYAPDSAPYRQRASAGRQWGWAPGRGWCWAGVGAEFN